MANNQSIDTSSLTALITEFSQLQAKDSITPVALGSILQRIADLLATAGTSDIQQALSNWHNAMLNAEPYFAGLNQANFDRDNILLNPTLVDPIEGQSYVGIVPISIQAATTEKAGAMKAQQVTDLNTLRNRYSDTVTPAVEAINEMQLGFGVIDFADLDNISPTDQFLGRLVKVQNSSGYADGYIMHIICSLYATQVFFTHCKINEEGELVIGTHDEKGFHIYKRYKNLTGSNTAWSRWQLVGGDEFADVKRSVDSILGNSNELTALSAKGQIAVEIVNGKLRVYGSSQLEDAGYVPYLFRHTRKRNHVKTQGNSRYSYGAISKGWHLLGSRHSVIVEGNVAKFSTNEPNKFHMPALSYSASPTALVHLHQRADGHFSLPWGRSMIRLYDSRSSQNRMIRLRFAIGYAKPIEHGKRKINILNLVSNLAEFSIVYNPKTNSFSLSR